MPCSASPSSLAASCQPAGNIRDACEALGDGTLSGRSTEDIRARFRKAAVGSQALFHRVRADVVEIVRILHRSMDVGRHIQSRSSG